MPKEKIFVVWDWTTEAIKMTLESLKAHPPEGFEFDVPMLTLQGGNVLRDVVLSGIQNANRVFVFTDKPNANVGFETGLAYGLGRKLALVANCSNLPSWLSLAPFTSSLVSTVNGRGSIAQMLRSEEIWVQRAASETDRGNDSAGGDPTLFLCPSTGEGEALDLERSRLFPGWRTVSDSFDFNDLPSLLRGVDRLVWTIAALPRGTEERDGGENAANGVIAGWFCAEILRRTGDAAPDAAIRELRKHLYVLWGKGARVVTDVLPFRGVFRDLPEYIRRLDAIPKRVGRPPRRIARRPLPAEAPEELLRRHVAAVSQSPLVPRRHHAGEYKFEAADLVDVILSPHSGRATRVDDKHYALQDFLRDLCAVQPQFREIVVLGESGVGKTTTSLWLSKELAKRGGDAPIPLYVNVKDAKVSATARLGISLLARTKPAGASPSRTKNRGFSSCALRFRQSPDAPTCSEVLEAAHSTGRRLVVFIDGVNEHSPPSDVVIFAQGLKLRPNVVVVMTSRPLVDAGTLWPARDTRFLELSHWTPLQLEQYAQSHQWAERLEGLPGNVRELLQLPLFAFLALSLAGAAPALRNEADVLKMSADRFLGGFKPGQKDKIRVCLEEFAYEMTKANSTNLGAESLRKILDRHGLHLTKVLDQLLDAGILRCPNRPAIQPHPFPKDPELVLEFFHQMMQEFLTATWVQRKRRRLPDDVSSNAFWREVPLLMLLSLANPENQNRLFKKTLKNGQFHIAATLATRIADGILSAAARGSVIGALLEQLKQSEPNADIIEAFRQLGQEGCAPLRQILRDDQLQNAVGKDELHLCHTHLDDQDRSNCFRRAVYYLGELGDAWLAEYMETRVADIRSIHLLCHVGEALLTIARRPVADPTQLRKTRDSIKGAAEALQKHDDPVVRGYAHATLIQLDFVSGLASEVVQQAGRLSDFLLGRAKPDQPHFDIEFWRRAHGVEAFSELAPPQDARVLLKKLFEIEDTATNSGGREYTNFPRVQSSIIKAIDRACARDPKGSAGWRGLLEAVFNSKRVAENHWASRHLESLLLRQFVSPKDVDWLKTWQKSRRLAPSIRQVLGNVLLRRRANA